MKVLGTVLKILAVLAAIAGAIYVAATYGDKIVAWAKRMLNKFNACCFCSCCEDVVPAEEVPADEVAVAAEECDFEG